MKSKNILSPDDAFILGNLCAQAVATGDKHVASSILNALEGERPENAGVFIMRSIHLVSDDKLNEAIEYLQNAPISTATKNQDEANAFLVVLLCQGRHFERAEKLAQAHLDDKNFTSESAIQTLTDALAEIESLKQSA